MTRAVGVVCLLAALAGAALLVVAVPRTAFTMYDEGVYYYQAVLFTRGQVPYRDYFAPQPPGVLLIGAASERIGAGIAGVRAFNWLCGLVLLYQTLRLTRRATSVAGLCEAGATKRESPPAEVGAPVGLEAPASQRPATEELRSAGPFAVALVAGTVVWTFQAIHGATNTPAACLEVAAALLLLGTSRRKFALAGTVVAVATAVRLPSLVAALGLLLLIRFADGRDGFWSRAMWFVGALGVGCAAIHGTLAVAVPGYFDNVVGFQLNRVRTDGDRAGQVLEFLSEPAVFLGLPAALWFLRSASVKLCGIAAHGLLSAVCISGAGNTLSVMYYLPLLPLFAVCAATATVRLAESVSRWFALVPLVAIVIRAPVVAGVILTQLRPNDEHAACVAAVKESKGDVVLTVDGRIAHLAGKRLPADYHATDPNALYQLGAERFHEWFARTLPAADMVVITPQLLGWMSRPNAEQVRASGKPVFFDTDATRAAFGP